MNKLLRILWIILIFVFWIGFTAGLMIGTGLHAEPTGKPLQQKFVLITIPRSAYSSQTGIYFDSWDLCESARKRIAAIDDFNNMICVPTEEKHK